ncbi:hypothetical protein [Pyxidicoccus xibeiensis]|uniref:hypothetical protein n=1 Tax=Pyxidicoccus xibeiensis TaxID=2906759 RepID=UPI0020A78FDC|nr:hypothetical protein [Pyxidicoccus xibeiensis]MCP3145303.1 hypothetical protein [Pyxidicoccus xibeiensis]
MTAGSTVGQPSPLGLRLVHAVVFLAFAAGVLVASRVEWLHVAHALGQPFHAGAPPRWLLLGASLLSAVGSLRLGVALARGRSAPGWASGAILLGVVGTLAAGRPQGLEETRSESAANVEFLRVARRVHLAMVGELQAHGGAPVEPEAWRSALARAEGREARVRTRTFQPVAPQVVWLPSEAAVPEPLVPGSLAVHVTPDGVGFTVRVVGLVDGRPALLRDDQGALLVLRGLYNPDLPPPTEQAVPPTP